MLILSALSHECTYSHYCLLSVSLFATVCYQAYLSCYERKKTEGTRESRGKKTGGNMSTACKIASCNRKQATNIKSEKKAPCPRMTPSHVHNPSRSAVVSAQEQIQQEASTHKQPKAARVAMYNHLQSRALRVRRAPEVKRGSPQQSMSPMEGYSEAHIHSGCSHTWARSAASLDFHA